jgi:hypothetical protein
MTTHLHPAQADGSPPPEGPGEDPHRWLHTQTGARPGEHPGRSGNPLVKVTGLAWLEFEKPDLDRAERFGTDFGFTVADRTPDTLLLRGRQAAAACLVIRRGPRPRFVGPAFAAAARDDLDRVARGTEQRSPRTGAVTPSCCMIPAGSRCVWCTACRNCSRCPDAPRCR